MMIGAMYAPLMTTQRRQRAHPHHRWLQLSPSTIVSALSLLVLLALNLIHPVSASGFNAAPSTPIFGDPQALSAPNLFPPPTSRGSTNSAAASTLDLNPHDMCRLTGRIDDASCDFESVERLLNSGDLFEKLDRLVATKYFRYYKVDLFKDCPFWVENGLCMSRSCGVEKADESDVPEEYRASRLSSVKTAVSSDVYPEQSSVEASTCACSSNDFCHWEDEEWSSEASWVDLKQNPERFTGYAGPSANRVWRTIYEENCFGAVPKGSLAARANLIASQGAGKSTPIGPGGFGASPFALGGLTPSLMDIANPPQDPTSSEQCLEKRVFYRIISGLHASISIHVCAEYLDQKTGEWAPNLDCFLERIAEHPERLQNVYFTYVLLTRALARAGDYLVASQKTSGGRGGGAGAGPSMREGDKIAEPETEALLHDLISRANANPGAPGFEEGKMFDARVNPEAPQLKEEFRDRFLNISRIMDCVGCDRCRLWGKLQTNGLGTALKILFGVEEKELDPRSNPDLLQRSELVALINTIHRFAESLRAVETFRHLYLERMASSKSSTSSSNEKDEGSTSTDSSVEIEIDVSGDSSTRRRAGREMASAVKPSNPIMAKSQSESQSESQGDRSTTSPSQSKSQPQSKSRSMIQNLVLTLSHLRHRTVASLSRLGSTGHRSLLARIRPLRAMGNF